MANKNDQKPPAPKFEPPSHAPEEQISERIRERREFFALNFEELARVTVEFDTPEKKGLTPAMLARYEKGIDGRPVLPGARELRILCGALSVTADWLLLGVETTDTAAQKIADGLSGVLRGLEVYQGFGPGRIKRERDGNHQYIVSQAKLAQKKKST